MAIRTISVRSRLREYLRACLSLFYGVATGVVLFTATRIGILLYDKVMNGSLRFENGGLRYEEGTSSLSNWIITYANAGAISAIGIVAVSSLIWWMLGRKLRRHVLSAICLGFVVSFLATFALYATLGLHPDLLQEFEQALSVGLLGSIAATVTWMTSRSLRADNT